MSVLETNTVDLVAIDEGTRETVIEIVDQLPWAIDEDDHLVKLQEKFNTALAFVETGQLYRDFPKAIGTRLSIRLNAAYPPSEKGRKLLTWFPPTARKLDLEFAYELWPQGRLPFPLQTFGVTVSRAATTSYAGYIFYMASPVQFLKAPTVTVGAGAFKTNQAGAATATTITPGATHTVNAISVNANSAGTAGQATLLQGGGGAGWVLASADF